MSYFYYNTGMSWLTGRRQHLVELVVRMAENSSSSGAGSSALGRQEFTPRLVARPEFVAGTIQRL
jgi:hypothetical protein